MIFIFLIPEARVFHLFEKVFQKMDTQTAIMRGIAEKQQALTNEEVADVAEDLPALPCRSEAELKSLEDCLRSEAAHKKLVSIINEVFSTNIS